MATKYKVIDKNSDYYFRTGEATGGFYFPEGCVFSLEFENGKSGSFYEDQLEKVSGSKKMKCSLSDAKYVIRELEELSESFNKDVIKRSVINWESALYVDFPFMGFTVQDLRSPGKDMFASGLCWYFFRCLDVPSGEFGDFLKRNFGGFFGSLERSAFFQPKEDPEVRVLCLKHLLDMYEIIEESEVKK